MIGSRYDPGLSRYDRSVVGFDLHQICLQMGFSRNEPHLYISGDNPELLDVYPELGYLRDIVYLLKAFMAPTSDALPEVQLQYLYCVCLCVHVDGHK